MKYLGMELIISEKINKSGEKYTGVAGKVSTKSWREKFGFKKKMRDFYFMYEDRIYVRAYTLTDTASELNSNFSFFFLDTKVASGSDRGKDIERIQFEFNLISKGSNQPLEIIKVSPDQEVVEEGTVSKKETVVVKQQAGGEGSAGTNVPLGIVNTKFGASGSLNYDKTKETVSKYDYSPHTIVTQGRGVGAYAIWEFKRDQSNL